MAEIRSVTLSIPLIGIFKGKIDILESKGVCAYHFEKTIYKNDFDNGTVCGFYGFLTTQEDTVDFIVGVPKQGMECDEFDLVRELTDEQIEILDSLKEGDVVVFDAFLETECRFGCHELYSFYTRIKSIKKYNDKNAANKIRALVSIMPINYAKKIHSI